MPIDRDVALAAEPRTRQITWTTRDVLLYHLSLGASRSGDPADLAYTYEEHLRVLPTFAIVAGGGISAGEHDSANVALPGVDFDLRKTLHGGQTLQVHAAIPPSGQAILRSRVADVWDKGKAAVVALEHHATDSSGNDLWTATMLIWARGEGGFGGQPGPSPDGEVPDRAPDAVVDTPTSFDTALLYRLNGDLNPLHADPAFAEAAGFQQPILHGLASYGIAGKVVVDEFGGHAATLSRLEVRFAGPLFPGETLRTRMWRDGENITLVATCPDRDDAPVLTHAGAVLRHA